ncbi:Dye-decolorizing peroxidase msp1 [Grifola frondosa]|uniref:Dye-decolorizing peroxidase msp1 n=1 Tax=Grifola frondosa TaxID=5627 RepID=A0A1C7M6K9_GRIFR|nr:Dye-decolorizing peroxidase msp1 [Grifola frondosa]
MSASYHYSSQSSTANLDLNSLYAHPSVDNMSTRTPPPLDPANVQGDILVGLPKKTQTYVFFQIDDNVSAFRTQLSKLVPLITSTSQVLNDHAQILANKQAAAEKGRKPTLLTLAGINIAFSHTGLVKMGITDEIGDSAFDEGQLADAQDLGDKGTPTSTGFVPDWIPAFKNPVHGVILISGDCHATVQATLIKVEQIFNVGAHNATLHEVLRLVGDVRPGAENGHEHFGFLDGISQPAVKDFDTKPNPGQETKPVTRPAWALDGSFLALRYLFQLVPEFNTFLKKNPLPLPGLTPEQGSELLGARLVGRWKSGAPIDITPLKDNPALGADPLQNNNFRYAFPDDPQTQDRCPFAAHTRKTNPRADLEDLPPPTGPVPTESRRIIRRGIQFGPEVTPLEASLGQTKLGRGLIFAAYQSNIVNGFQFIQHSWANTAGFPIQKPVTPGFDPIIGQAADPTSRTLTGTNPNNQSASLSLPIEWVVPKGGEYFFAPSISTLRDTFAFGAHVV